MQKNRQLFEQFIGQNLDGAYRFAYSYVKNQQDAEDIVSQSVVKALTQVHRLKEVTAMKSWFYRIVANSANSYLRKGKKLVYLENEEWDAVGSVTDSYKDADLRAQLAALPKMHREVIVLRFFEGFSLKEISEIAGININTVKTRLYKGLELLRIDMKEEEYEKDFRRYEK